MGYHYCALTGLALQSGDDVISIPIVSGLNPENLTWTLAGLPVETILRDGYPMDGETTHAQQIALDTYRRYVQLSPDTSWQDLCYNTACCPLELVDDPSTQNLTNSSVDHVTKVLTQVAPNGQFTVEAVGLHNSNVMVVKLPWDVDLQGKMIALFQPALEQAGYTSMVVSSTSAAAPDAKGNYHRSLIVAPAAGQDGILTYLGQPKRLTMHKLCIIYVRKDAFENMHLIQKPRGRIKHVRQALAKFDASLKRLQQWDMQNDSSYRAYSLVNLLKQEDLWYNSSHHGEFGNNLIAEMLDRCDRKQATLRLFVQLAHFRDVMASLYRELSPPSPSIYTDKAQSRKAVAGLVNLTNKVMGS